MTDSGVLGDDDSIGVFFWSTSSLMYKSNLPGRKGRDEFLRLHFPGNTTSTDVR